MIYKWSSSFLSALDRPLRRAAGGVFVCSADQCGAEGAHPEARARPEHHPGHVLPSAPWCGRVGCRRHGEHPGANQRGHCNVHWYVLELKSMAERYVCLPSVIQQVSLEVWRKELQQPPHNISKWYNSFGLVQLCTQMLLRWSTRFILKVSSDIKWFFTLNFTTGPFTCINCTHANRKLANNRRRDCVSGPTVCICVPLSPSWTRKLWL